MSTRPCCTGEGPQRPASRRFSGAGASILSGVVLVALPKCPMCLAAWLTVVSGFGVSAAALAPLRGIILVVFVAAVALAVLQLRRQNNGRDGSPREELATRVSG